MASLWEVGRSEVEQFGAGYLRCSTGLEEGQNQKAVPSRQGQSKQYFEATCLIGAVAALGTARWAMFIPTTAGRSALIT
jgi:hypothetical protein